MEKSEIHLSSIQVLLFPLIKINYRINFLKYFIFVYQKKKLFYRYLQIWIRSLILNVSKRNNYNFLHDQLSHKNLRYQVIYSPHGKKSTNVNCA